MDKVGLVFQQFVDAFNDVALAQHHLIPQGHELVLHVRPEPVDQVDALVEEALEEALLDVPPVGKHLAVEHLREHLPHFGISVVHVCGGKAECEDVALLVAQQVQLETVAPSHRTLPVPGKSVEHLVEFPSHVVAYGDHRAVHETNACTLAEALDAHEGHQVEEHAGHEFHKARVGHRVRETARQVTLDEEQVIVLEISERAEVVVQQDGHDFALGHLALSVSQTLISLVCGGYVEVFTKFSVQILAELIQYTEYFSNFG